MIKIKTEAEIIFKTKTNKMIAEMTKTTEKTITSEGNSQNRRL